ncbi:hypothetical protein SAMN05192544_102826 [Paraburkholderia hospita]|nr:hypothetical protein SAMN05192544_102826 [Paraburkholderia hospita]
MGQLPSITQCAIWPARSPHEFGVADSLIFARVLSDANRPSGVQMKRSESPNEPNRSPRSSTKLGDRQPLSARRPSTDGRFAVPDAILRYRCFDRREAHTELLSGWRQPALLWSSMRTEVTPYPRVLLSLLVIPHRGAFIRPSRHSSHLHLDAEHSSVQNRYDCPHVPMANHLLMGGATYRVPAQHESRQVGCLLPRW